MDFFAPSLDFGAPDLAEKLYMRRRAKSHDGRPSWAELPKHKRNEWQKTANDLQNTVALQRLRFASATRTASSSQQS